MDPITVKGLVSGIVQGVGFRYFTAMEAKSHNLVGYARNLSDGTVEFVASGAAKDVEALLKWLAIGPPSARVDQISWKPIQYQLFSGFSIG